MLTLYSLILLAVHSFCSLYDCKHSTLPALCLFYDRVVWKQNVEQITILDSTGATPPEVGVCTVKIRDDAGHVLKNDNSTSFAGNKRYTFNPERTEYGMTGSFGSANVSVVDIEAFSDDPPPVRFIHIRL